MSAKNRLHWDGLDQLKALLRALPADLANEAAPIVYGAAEDAKAEIEAAYPERTGALRRGLKLNKDVAVGGTFLGANALLYNNAPHAYIFEHGTQARHTDIGANRGSMPAGNVFGPRVARARRRMYDDLADLLEAHGMEVRRGAA